MVLGCQPYNMLDNLSVGAKRRVDASRVINLKLDSVRLGLLKLPNELYSNVGLHALFLQPRVWFIPLSSVVIEFAENWKYEIHVHEGARRREEAHEVRMVNEEVSIRDKDCATHK